MRRRLRYTGNKKVTTEGSVTPHQIHAVPPAEAFCSTTAAVTVLEPQEPPGSHGRLTKRWNQIHHWGAVGAGRAGPLGNHQPLMGPLAYMNHTHYTPRQHGMSYGGSPQQE